LSIAAIAAFATLTGCGSGAPRRPAQAATPVQSAEPAQARSARGQSKSTDQANATDQAGMATELPLPELPAEALASYQRALDAMAAGAWADAEPDLRQLTMQYPSLAGPLVNLAIVYRQTGQNEAAETALERALALNPVHPAANNELGILARERGDFNAAEAAYRQAIAGDPDYALAHYNLGVLLDVYLQRRDEALEQYEKYQSLSGEPDASLDFWVVDLRRRLGRPDEPVRLAQEVGE
jgi:tetratricopeptide (TPR) repeat protein